MATSSGEYSTQGLSGQEQKTKDQRGIATVVQILDPDIDLPAVDQVALVVEDIVDGMDRYGGYSAPNRGRFIGSNPRT